MNDLLTPEQIVLIKARDEALFLECNEGVGFAGSDRRALLRDREAIAERLEAMESDLREAGHEDNNHALLGAANGIRALVTAIRGEK